jgi:SAM-dependent methyltransferase
VETPSDSSTSVESEFLRRVLHSAISAEEMAELIAAVTDEPLDRVLKRLRAEYEHPGRAVRQDFEKHGLDRYKWGDGLIGFYEQTDAFLYELAIWNWNKIKRKMRRRTGHYLEGAQGKRFDVLALGDGLGFDCVALAARGHRVTYFEVPGYTQKFAETLFQRCGISIEVLTDPVDIPRGAFDAVVCLDVLEHVPDPTQFVSEICQYLRPDGRLLAHAPFYMIHPDYPTHLLSNRQFAGSLKPYTANGLTLLDGDPGWNPLVLGRGDNDVHQLPGASGRRRILGMVGRYLAMARCCTAPIMPLHVYRGLRRRWFVGEGKWAS